MRPRNSEAAHAQIVEAAEAVLKRDGFHEFSTRRVAEACGMAVGNLTYHFPTKAKLIEAVMAAVCARYAQARRAEAQRHASRPRQWLETTLSWMIEDAVSQDTSALFQELWTMARHHPAGPEIVDGFYKDALGWLREDLARHYPRAEPADLDRAAHLMLTFSEGSTALFSRRATWPGGPSDMAWTGATLIENLLRNGPRPEPNAL